MGSMVVGYSSSYTSPGLVSMRDNATATFEVTKEIVSRNHCYTRRYYSKANQASLVDEIVFKQTCLARRWRNLEYSGEMRGTRCYPNSLLIRTPSQGRAIGIIRHVCFRNIFRRYGPLFRPSCSIARTNRNSLRIPFVRCAYQPGETGLVREWFERRTTILKRRRRGNEVHIVESSISRKGQ